MNMDYFVKNGLHNGRCALIINEASLMGKVSEHTPHVMFMFTVDRKQQDFFTALDSGYFHFVFYNAVNPDLKMVKYIWKGMRRNGLLWVKGEDISEELFAYFTPEEYDGEGIVLRKVDNDEVYNEYQLLPDATQKKYGDKFLMDALAKLPLDEWGETQEIVDMYREVYTTLSKAGYTPFVFGGSVLGLIRDGELLPWDDDVDIGILDDNFKYQEALPKMKQLLEPLGYHVWKDAKDEMCGALIHVNKGGFDTYGSAHIDIKFFETNKGKMYFDGWGLPAFEESWFKNLKKIESMGTEFLVPEDHEVYLTYDFGTNWKERIVGGFGDFEHQLENCWKWDGERRY